MSWEAAVAYGIPAIASAGSAIYSSFSANAANEEQYKYSKRLMRQNNEWQEEQAQKQMDFQTSANKAAMDFNERMMRESYALEMAASSTAYQRAVEDLEKAGLNPILAYTQGGASTPSVSSASGVTSDGSKATLGDDGSNVIGSMRDRVKLGLNVANNYIHAASNVALAALSIADSGNQMQSKTKAKRKK